MREMLSTVLQGSARIMDQMSVGLVQGGCGRECSGSSDEVYNFTTSEVVPSCVVAVS